MNPKVLPCCCVEKLHLFYKAIDLDLLEFGNIILLDLVTFHNQMNLNIILAVLLKRFKMKINGEMPNIFILSEILDTNTHSHMIIE